jgi:hypothetical protein
MGGCCGCRGRWWDAAAAEVAGGMLRRPRALARMLLRWKSVGADAAAAEGAGTDAAAAEGAGADAADPSSKGCRRLGG